jgi:hypothetical protein
MHPLDVGANVDVGRPLGGVPIAASSGEEGAMGIFPEVQRFLQAHRDCGEVTKEAGRPSADGYRIHVACPCGAVLDRWVTPAAARHDLVHTNLLATRN